MCEKQNKINTTDKCSRYRCSNKESTRVYVHVSERVMEMLLHFLIAFILAEFHCRLEVSLLLIKPFRAYSYPKNAFPTIQMLYFRDKVSLYIPGWAGAHYVV